MRNYIHLFSNFNKLGSKYNYNRFHPNSEQQINNAFLLIIYLFIVYTFTRNDISHSDI